MGLFKKRTFKSVGKNIGLSIKRQNEKARIIRTLKKEDEERERERTLNRKIKELKSKRPSFIKSVSGIMKKGAGYYQTKQRESLARSKRKMKPNIKPLSISDLI